MGGRSSGLGTGFLDCGSNFWTGIGCLDWDSGSWIDIWDLRFAFWGLGLTFQVLRLIFGDGIDMLGSWVEFVGVLG